VTEKTEAELVAERVDIQEWGATEADEMEVLAGLGYVLNPATGIFEGDGDEAA